MGSALDQGEELLRVDAHRLGVQPEDDVDRAGLGEPGRAQADRAHALRGELGGERAREALHRRPRGAHPIDVSFNATGIPQVGIQGIPLTSLPVESFALPIATYLRSNFLTARAAARRMVEKKSGAILMITPEPARRRLGQLFAALLAKMKPTSGGSVSSLAPPGPADPKTVAASLIEKAQHELLDLRQRWYF